MSVYNNLVANATLLPGVEERLLSQDLFRFATSNHKHRSVARVHEQVRESSAITGKRWTTGSP